MSEVYAVGDVNRYIKNMFSQDFLLRSLSVRGEASNVKYHSSGHLYFTLKDSGGTLGCIMFAGYRKGLKFLLQEGQQIVVTGNIDVYERDGKYQLYAKSISLDGEGLLYERFLRLKQELEERGMFDKSYKQPIPSFCQRLGVVTADTGAAIRDIIDVAKRRNPYVQIILYPAIVQGAAAAASIVNGIHALEAQNVDVMIVGRGGGSMEDLWAFNEEIVVQAVFDSPIPIISAVGHETDFTLIDFVSDLRAPTPSAAAELAVFQVDAFLKQLEGKSILLQKEMAQKLVLYRNRIEQTKSFLQRLSPESKIQEQRFYLLRAQEVLETKMQEILQKKKHELHLRAAMLDGLSPLKKMEQGYAYVSNQEGQHIHSVEQVAVGNAYRIYLQDGKVEMEAKAVEKSKQGE